MFRFLSLVLLVVACQNAPPVSQLPLTPVASAVGAVRFELQLPEGARETAQGEWKRVSASQALSVSVELRGAPETLDQALQRESSRGATVLRSSQLSDGFALTTPGRVERGIVGGVHCTARLDVPEGRPSAEQLAYLDAVCASLRVLAN